MEWAPSFSIWPDHLSLTISCGCIIIEFQIRQKFSSDSRNCSTHFNGQHPPVNRNPDWGIFWKTNFDGCILCLTEYICEMSILVILLLWKTDGFGLRIHILHLYEIVCWKLSCAFASILHILSLLGLVCSRENSARKKNTEKSSNTEQFAS